MRPTCTHVALFCGDIESSVRFYSGHVGLHEVHRRCDDETTVVWMAEQGREKEFVLVLLGIQPPAGEGPFAHLGYAVGSKKDVDERASRGHDAGIEVQGPIEGGPVVGYYCLLRDPDGNWVEFSHGQSLG
jgi:catechol 2,3-dioxygenase-like lactoylglutathione lyase family enzyme